jgi:hypothetical protein
MLRRNRLVSFLALIGLVSLSYLLGAAAIFFELPSSSFLRRAFVGGVTLYERRGSQSPSEESFSLPSVGQIDTSGKACYGYTLCMYGSGARAVLVNMRGDAVHQWQVPFSQLWPAPTHVHGRIEDTSVYFNDGYVFPNGDLLAVLEGPTNLQNVSPGYGLVKLDKDSRVLWKYAEKCHHDVDVAEDGTIYALVNEIVERVPPALAYVPTPCIVDCVDVLGPQGQRIKRIPLLEAFLESPYAALFGKLERAGTARGTASAGSGMALYTDDVQRRDVLHTNAVKVLRRKLAPKFPLFKAGQLLVSARQLDAIAVLDPDSGKVVWAAHGPWRAQHDPSFLDNGHLLLFDNLFSERGSRVLEYDPQTQAFPWVYPGEKGKPFLSELRGMCQRLPNGNTLIVNSQAGEAFEVTPDREVVWTCSYNFAEFYRVRRYTPEQLPFLGRDRQVRP